MKNNRQMTASLLFAAAFGLSVFFGFFQAFGALAGPGAAFESEAQKHGYDGETWQRLMDDTLEYEEIQNLVHTFHPEISRAWENYGESVSLLR